MPKALTQGLGFKNRLEDRLEEQSSTACGRRLCGIGWDWHFCWWPAKSILCEGWLAEPSNWKAWITGSLIFSEVSNFSSEAAAEAVFTLPLQALGVDVEEVPHGTHVALLGRLMDILASGHEPNPLRAVGGLGSLTGIPT